MKKILSLLLLGYCFGALSAQGIRENHIIDLSLAYGKDVQNYSLEWSHRWGILWKKRISLGYGLRFNNVFGQGTQFVSSFQSAGRDTLRVSNAQFHSLNISVCAEIAFLKWLDAGANIDLVGFTFGPRRTGTYYSSSFTEPVSFQTVKPEVFNVFLFGRNDRGIINSQFFLRFWLPHHISLRAGFSILHLYYRSDETLNFSNDRFFIDPKMGFISIAWSPGRTAWRKKE